MRRKILTAFSALGLLLFFAGVVSYLELNRLSEKTKNLLESSSSVMDVSKRMLDAVQDQNTSLLQMIAKGATENDSLFIVARANFEKALSEATITVRDLSELDSIYTACDSYNEVVDSYQWQGTAKDIDWFANVYKSSYYQLTRAIKEYMTVSQNSLARRAESLENNAYRAITPGILALGVAILILLMLYFLLDLYYFKPFSKMNKSLRGYITSRIPFNVKIEGKDEVLELKESIETLILTTKKRTE